MPNPPRTALITGASRGLGAALALALGRAGWRVGICSRSAESVAQALERLESAGVQAAGVAADVGEPDDCARLVRHVEERLGPVTTLVNNAGVLHAAPVEELTLEQWDESLRTNVRSMFLMTRAVLPGMRARRGGDIVNIASLSARNGWAGGSAYTASKHAVLGFSRSLMMELRGDGIRVLTICPGSIDTEMIRRQTAFESDPDRILKPDDVAATIVQALQLPGRALVSELDIRPTTP